MSVGIQTDPIERNERLWARGLDAYPSTYGETMGATWDESLTRNPAPSLLRAMERSGYYGYTDEFGNEQPAPRQSTILPAAKANEEYGIAGELSFGQDTPEPIAQELHQLKREELQRRDVLNRSTGGVGRTISQLGVGLAASVLDPLNIASAFIPVVGPARYGIWAAKYGATPARLARGGIEGAVGAAVVEPVVYGVAKSEQADYDATDSLLNLAFGTVLGGGLHAGLGKIGDVISARHAQEPALKASVAAVSEDRPVDVDAFLRTDPEIAGAIDTADISPLDVGMVRMYHGGNEGTLEGDGGRWFSSDLRYAEGYAGKSGGDGRVYYVDVPENHPIFATDYPEQHVTRGFTVNAELPADIASQMQPFRDAGVISRTAWSEQELKQAAERASKRELHPSDAAVAADLDRVVAASKSEVDAPAADKIKEIEADIADLAARAGDTPEVKDVALAQAEARAKAYQQAAVCEYMKPAAE